MRVYVRNTLEILGITVVIILVWQFLEKIILGEVTPNIVDSIVGTILAYSLYCNYKRWMGE